jgi:aminoglycoside/choline kinase family phosphotransferase
MGIEDKRLQSIEHWLRVELKWPLDRLEPASADASFRRYFRAFGRDGTTRVVMDAPPEQEDIGPYLKVAALLERCEVHVPKMDAVDLKRGLILQEDLGTVPLLTQLQNGGDPSLLYGEALSSLARIQCRSGPLIAELLPYDRAALMREMALMPEWFCARHLQLPEDARRDALLAGTMDFLVHEITLQPVVVVHRDYHSRNLMVTATRAPGIIDFQDALAGPIAYDLVSLLKDCYIAWPRAQVESWVRGYRARLTGAGIDVGRDDAEFLRWFDLVGLQRHIKVLGIFARLWYRDGKRAYLADLPLTLEYVRDCAQRYTELRDFARWVETTLVAALPGANAREQAGSGH